MSEDHKHEDNKPLTVPKVSDQYKLDQMTMHMDLLCELAEVSRKYLVKELGTPLVLGALEHVKAAVMYSQNKAYERKEIMKSMESLKDFFSNLPSTPDEDKGFGA